MRLEKTALTGPRIRLEPLCNAHREGLARAIEDGALWQIPVTYVPHPDNLPSFFAHAESQFEAGKELAYAIVDIETGRIAGSTRFRCFEPAHKRVEIGFTFLGASWQRTYANTESKYLLLQHAFEHWRVNRVEFLTDALNATSRAAINRLGAVEEGILRHHMVTRDGRLRDSVVFSIVAPAWPRIRQTLGAGLGVIGPEWLPHEA